MKKTLIWSSLIVCLALTGCATSGTTSLDTTETEQIKIDPIILPAPELTQIEQTSRELQPFILNYQGHHYFSYLDQTAPILIIDQKNNDQNKIYLQNGKVIAVLYQQEWFFFNRLNAMNSPQSNPSFVKKVKRYADRLTARLGYNRADKEIDQINTGDNAKLNYLCISKLQQVTATKRVFRSSKNFAHSNDQLTAEVRLNGKDFYAMDCLVHNDRITLLSLLKK